MTLQTSVGFWDWFRVFIAVMNHQNQLESRGLFHLTACGSSSREVAGRYVRQEPGGKS